MPDSTYTQAPAIQTASDTLPLHQWLAAPCDTAQQSASQACHLLQLRPGNQVTPVVCFQSLSDIHTPFFSLQEVPLPPLSKRCFFSWRRKGDGVRRRKLFVANGRYCVSRLADHGSLLAWNRHNHLIVRILESGILSLEC